MIVKVQRALAGKNAGKRLLVYDEPHELYGEIEVTAQFIRGLLGDEWKGYFEAHINPAGELSLDARVEDQPW